MSLSFSFDFWVNNFRSLDSESDKDGQAKLPKPRKTINEGKILIFNIKEKLI